MIETELLSAALQGAAPSAHAALAQELGALFARHALPRGAPVLRQGEVWNAALLIESGLVRMHFLRRDGKEFNKNFFAEGALVCPLTPAMMSGRSLFGISCIEPTQLWRCDATVFRELLQRRDAWAPLQTALMTRLLDGKLQREHELLALDGRHRYAAFCARFPSLAARVPLMHLATYLGMTDVSLSRLRRRASAPGCG